MHFNLALFVYQQYLEFGEFHLYDGESFLKPVLIKTSKNKKIYELFRIFFRDFSFCQNSFFKEYLVRGVFNRYLDALQP